MKKFQEARREFLKGAVASGTVAASSALPLTALAQAKAPAAAAATDAPAGYVFLMLTEAAFIEAAVEHMFPADDKTPGGVDLGINIFIDRALAGPWGKGDRLYMDGPWQAGAPSQGYQLPLSPAQLFRQGMASANTSCQKKYGKSFDQLRAEQKEEVLQGLASGKLEFDNGLPSKAFFDALYQCVVQGIFADPIYGGNKNKAGWKLVGFPGVVATHARNIVQYKNKPFPTTYLGISDMA
jgi:gluconate 2-dehydrogenase gamma chain